VQKVLTTQQLLGLQEEASHVYSDPALIEYAIKLVTATRNPTSIGLKEVAPSITFGASPRASINLILAARSLAFVRGRSYTLPQDVLDMALDVMRHRLVLSYEALSDNVNADDLLKRILNRIPVPEVPLHEHTKIRVNA
jgi:MoxR-like ATPase